MKKSVILLFFFILPTAGCKKDAPDLLSLTTQIQSIMVYDLDGHLGKEYGRYALHIAPHSELNTDLFKKLAPQAKYRDSHPIWKGSSLAIITLTDGTEKQLALSYYGAFFKILGEDGYYYYEGQARDAFKKAYNEEIIAKVFIPQRTGRTYRTEMQ